MFSKNQNLKYLCSLFPYIFFDSPSKFDPVKQQQQQQQQQQLTVPHARSSVSYLF